LDDERPVALGRERRRLAGLAGASRLDVGDPRLRVLEATPEAFRATIVRLR
jgi:hypothetical protein